MSGDQAEDLRRQRKSEQISRPSAHSALRITITGGKGGVGKSNFALNAAITLATFERKVLLVDADANLANLDLLLGVHPQWNLSDLIDGRKDVREVLAPGPEGISILPGASGDLSLLNLSAEIEHRLTASFNELDQTFDVIIIDTSAGLSPQIISYAAGADEVIIITQPEPTAAADAYAMIKVISRQSPNARVHILVNMVKSNEQAADLFDRLNLVVQNFLQFPIEFLGALPFDPFVQQAVSMQKPFCLQFPKAPASIAVRMLMRKLLRLNKPLASETKGTLLSRLFYVKRSSNA